MLFRRLQTEGLSHNSYVVADGGEAVVIDPRRDVDVYLDLASAAGFRITTVLETHRNEDYVIGSTALAEATGARILHSGKTDFAYGTPVGDGDEIGAGKMRLRVLETPGHTPDSLTFTLADRRSGDDPILAFTGDALFVGDTGRTDLLGSDHERELAEQLHASLFDKILPLGDDVILCPGHGGGSVCGGAILDRDESTLGYERRNNPSLQKRDRSAFVELKLGEKHLKAPYMEHVEKWNTSGDAPIHLRPPVIRPLEPEQLEDLGDDGAVVVDTRMPQAFAGGHVPGSYNIWFQGLTGYLGWLVAVGTPIVLVLPDEAGPDAAVRTLLRLGYDEIEGYLRGGFETWQNSGRRVTSLGTVDTTRLRAWIDRDDGPCVVDVRKPGEVEEGSLDGARRIFVGDLEHHLGELPRDRPIVTMCSVGHRGGTAASVLARHGFQDVHNYLGGYTAWQAASVEVQV